MEIQDIDELLDEAFPNIKKMKNPTSNGCCNLLTQCQMLLAKRGCECLENPATMEVFAERSAHMSIKACYNVQRSYNYEVSAYSTRHNSPSTPNKPVIRPEVDQKYPQISFSKKLKVAFKELDDENPRNSGESSDQNVLNTVDVVDWRKWLEKILEFPIEETRTQILNPYSIRQKINSKIL
ncbi:unnamed protein product [Rhizophagus irregularis]|nr:unnamed protein product [Rhizophagus irregularis]